MSAKARPRFVPRMVTLVPPSGGPATGVTYSKQKAQISEKVVTVLLQVTLSNVFFLLLPVWTCHNEITNADEFLWMLKGKCALSAQVAVKAIKNTPHACIQGC